MDNSQTSFDQSHWATNEFADGYLQESDIFIPQRRLVLQVIKQIFGFFLDKGIARPHVIDLGCGDGAVTQALLEANNDLLSTLIDGSDHMLESAKKNIPGANIKKTIRISFQELYRSSIEVDDADFVVSSLAIHHLNEMEKGQLFTYIYTKLKHGGLFINFDPVLSPSQELEELNLHLWRQWITNYESRLTTKREKSLDYVPAQYKGNVDNVPGTLESQLEMLRNTGFYDVTTYYTYGLFCLFGGRKK